MFLPTTAQVPLSADGKVCVFTLADADFALDVTGFVSKSSPMVGVSPARYLETRCGPGFHHIRPAVGRNGRLAAKHVCEGADRRPRRGRQRRDGCDCQRDTPSTQLPTASSPLYPCTAKVPTASSVNYFTGQVVPNGAVVDLSDDGAVCIYSLAATDLLLDVTGFVPAGTDSLTSLNPQRVFDSRKGETITDGIAPGPRLAARQIIAIQIAGRAGIPASATAVFANLGVVFPDGPGFATLYPCTPTVPGTSSVNHSTGRGPGEQRVRVAVGRRQGLCVHAGRNRRDSRRDWVRRVSMKRGFTTLVAVPSTSELGEPGHAQRRGARRSPSTRPSPIWARANSYGEPSVSAMLRARSKWVRASSGRPDSTSAWAARRASVAGSTGTSPRPSSAAAASSAAASAAAPSPAMTWISTIRGANRRRVRLLPDSGNPSSASRCSRSAVGDVATPGGNP